MRIVPPAANFRRKFDQSFSDKDFLLNRVITSPSAATEGDILFTATEIALAALAPLFVLTTGADSDEGRREADKSFARAFSKARRSRRDRRSPPRRRNSPLGVSFLLAFFFAPPSAKEKSGKRPKVNFN